MTAPRKSSRWRHWLRCSYCRCWFGTHDHVVLHRDGKTDNADAIQLLIARSQPIPSGSYPITGPLRVDGR